MEQPNTYLKTVPFTDFLLWDVKRYITNVLNSNYPLVLLSKLIFERSERVKLYDFPDEEFKILGVNNKTGLFDAYTELGANINQSYKKVYNQDLAYNPYRINVGSIGWKTPNQKNEFISPAYVVFGTNDELSSEYLYLMFKTDTFNKIINDNTTGSVRQNLKFDTLVNIKIPLPTLPEQNSIVAQYNQKIQLAQQQEQEADNLVQEIEEYLMDRLGLKKLELKESIKGLQLISFKNIDRWGILAKDMRILNGLTASKFQLKKIGDVFSFANRSWNKKRYNKDTFRYIELGAIDTIDGITEVKEISISKAPSRATQKVVKGDLLIGTTRPYLKRFVIIDNIYEGDICSSGFTILEPNQNTELAFLKEFLMSFYGLEQLKNRMTGATYPAITTSELKEILVPFPPRFVQIEIASEIKKMRRNIKELQDKAKQNREDALHNFEQEIFNR